MKQETRQARHLAISEAAYRLLAENGYQATSMLRIAKAANASNQTMYRWYGDKRGLFKQMVEDNAAAIRTAFEVLGDGAADPLACLERIAPTLISVLLSDRPVLLNRAAAADATGELGAVIAEAGRGRVVPTIAALIARAVEEGSLHFTSPDAAAELYIDLVIGDLQIRRIIGAIDAPTERETALRAAQAFSAFLTLGKADAAGRTR